MPAEARAPESGRAARGSARLNEVCLRAAAVFDRVLADRIEAGDYSATNEAIARRLGVDEKQIREYRDGRKRVPAGILLALPPAIAQDLRAALDREANPAPPPDRNVVDDLLRLSVDLGRVSEGVLEANADGRIDAIERRGIRARMAVLHRHLSESMRALGDDSTQDLDGRSRR